MPMYSFNVESFTSIASRSVAGLDDVWVIMTVNVGSRAAANATPIGIGVTAGQGLTGPWSSGAFQVAVGESGIAACTLVSLTGSTPAEQEAVVAALGTKILAAVAGAAAGAAETAIRGLFGTAGELPAPPPLPAGQPDCRGLLGVYVAPFTATAAVAAVGQTSAPISLSAPAPASCLPAPAGAGPTSTGPQSTAVFSLWQSPNLFTQSTPITVLASGPALTEIFMVGTDGLLRYNARGASGRFGAWQARWAQPFSQSAPLAAVAGTQQTRYLFGTGTDGVIYRMSATQAADWGDWTAISEFGQFLPDTPVAAISLNGTISLFAVDPDGTVQTMMWTESSPTLIWASIGNMVFARRTPLLAISHVDTWVELFGVNAQGQDVHTSHGPNLIWGGWDLPAGPAAAAEPASHKLIGLTFPVYSAPGVSSDNGMAWFRVDGNGMVNEVGWNNGTGWIPRRTISTRESTSVFSSAKAIPSGPVSGVKMGNQLLLYMVDAQTGRVAVASWAIPVPFNQNAPWSAWTLFPAGPTLSKVGQIALISPDDSHVELFAVDRLGMVYHVTEDTGPGWGTWAAV